MTISDSLGQALAAVNRGVSDPLRSLSQFNTTLGVNISPDSSLKSIEGQLTSSVGQNDTFGAAGPNKHVLFNMYRRAEPLYVFSWFCILPTVNQYSLDWNYVEEFTAPFRSFDTTTQYRTGRVYHYAGQHSISNLSLRFYDDSSGKAGAYLENWRNTVMAGRGIYNYPDGPQGYKKTISLIILDVSRITQVYKLDYIGCWPVTAEPFNLQSASSDRIISSQEFSVDDINITVRSMPISGLANLVYSAVADFPKSFVNNLMGTQGFNIGALNGDFNSALTQTAKSIF